MRIVLLDSFTADQDQGIDAWPGLEDLAEEVILYPRSTGLDLAEICAGAAVIVTNKVVISGALMRRLQPALRYIGVSATGTNIVDVASARSLGIAVTNVPAYSTDSVAQLTMALILQLQIDVAGHAAAVRDGAWTRCPDFCFFLHPLPELRGKTLVILGMGAIGRQVATLASAFGMNVVAAHIPGTPERADRLALELALPRADVVSLHCPLTPKTQALVNSAFLAQMKPDAILINTARGGLIDENALAEALRTGQIAGAGLDVLSHEPPPADHILLRNETRRARLLITPHIGWGSVAARERLRRETVLNIAAFLRGEKRNRID